MLYCGNLGDSRCVVGSVCSDSGLLEAVEMSKDHSATTDSERLRVKRTSALALSLMVAHACMTGPPGACCRSHCHQGTVG